MAAIERVTTTKSTRSRRSIRTTQSALSRQGTAVARNPPVFPAQYLDDHSTYQGADDGIDDEICETHLSPEASFETSREKGSQENGLGSHDYISEDNINSVSSRSHAGSLPVTCAIQRQKTRTRSILDPKMVRIYPRISHYNSATLRIHQTLLTLQPVGDVGRNRRPPEP